jgi:hypothetical protein
VARKGSSVLEGLAPLRERVASELMRKREAQTALEAGQGQLEAIAAEVDAAYEREDEGLVRNHRQRLHEVKEEVADLQGRVVGAERRLERVQLEVDQYIAEHGAEILRERLAQREAAARETTLALNGAVHDAIRLHRRYLADRQAIQGIVTEMEPGSGATNGPAASYPWERQLVDLDRAVREVDEISPPTPRWHGREFRAQQDDIAAKLQAERRELRRRGA